MDREGGRSQKTPEPVMFNKRREREVRVQQRQEGKIIPYGVAVHAMVQFNEKEERGWGGERDRRRGRGEDGVEREKTGEVRRWEEREREEKRIGDGDEEE